MPNTFIDPILKILESEVVRIVRERGLPTNYRVVKGGGPPDGTIKTLTFVRRDEWFNIGVALDPRDIAVNCFGITPCDHRDDRIDEAVKAAVDKIFPKPPSNSGGDRKSHSKQNSSYNKYYETMAARAAQESKVNINEIVKDGRFVGATFVLTVDMDSMTRDDAEVAIKMLGGEVNNRNVTKKTTHVVIGGEKGPGCEASDRTGKHRKALEYIDKGMSIKLWGEVDFLEALGLAVKS